MENKFFVIITTLTVLSLAVGPVVAQNQTVPGVPESDVHTVLDSDLYVASVEWDPGNDTAYLTLVADGRQQIEVVDAVKFEAEKQVNIQRFTLRDGEQTIQVDAWSRGRQVVDVSTDSTLTRVESAAELDVLVKTYWFIPVSIGFVFTGFYTLRGKRKKERDRGTKVYDLLLEKYITVVHRSIQVDTSTWLGKIKYYLVRAKEGVLDVYYGGTVRSTVMMVLAVALVDLVLLNGRIYYTISSDPLATRVTLMSLPIAVVAAYLSHWIVGLFSDEWEHFLLVTDEGELDHDGLSQYDSVQEFLEAYAGRDDQGYRFLAMDDEVFNRFDRVLDEELTTKKYGDGSAMKIARKIDLENNAILPDPEVLHDTGEVRADERKIHRNHEILVDLKQAWNTLKGSAELIEDQAMEIAHRRVAEQYQDALRGDEDTGIRGLIEDLSDTGDADQDGDEDVRQAIQDFKDAMDPRTSKARVEREEDGDE